MHYRPPRETIRFDASLTMIDLPCTLLPGTRRSTTGPRSKASCRRLDVLLAVRVQPAIRETSPGHVQQLLRARQSPRRRGAHRRRYRSGRRPVRNLVAGSSSLILSTSTPPARTSTNGSPDRSAMTWPPLPGGRRGKPSIRRGRTISGPVGRREPWRLTRCLRRTARRNSSSSWRVKDHQVVGAISARSPERQSWT